MRPKFSCKWVLKYGPVERGSAEQERKCDHFSLVMPSFVIRFVQHSKCHDKSEHPQLSLNSRSQPWPLWTHAL